MSDPQFVKSWQSKDKLQTQLNGATASGANDRVGGSDVRRRTSATERLNRRIVESEAVLSPVRIGEIGMIENIEKLGPELKIHPFAERQGKIFDDGKISVHETRAIKRSTRGSPQFSRRRFHEGAWVEPV